MTELTVQYARVGSEMIQVLNSGAESETDELINQHQQRMMNRMQGKTPEATQNQ